MRKNDHGFTLVELLASMMIISILAAITIPSMTGFINDTKKRLHKTETALVYQAVQSYLLEEYSKGNDDGFELCVNLTMGEMGSKEHPLMPLLAGAYTRGAQIIGIELDESNKLYGLTYLVSGYEIEMKDTEGVISTEIKHRN